MLKSSPENSFVRPVLRDERDHPIEVVVDHVYEVLSGREDAFNYYTLP